MSYRIDIVELELNVILVTFMGNITAQDVSEAVAEVVEQAESMQRPVYQIGDFRQADGTFASILQIGKTFPNMWRIYRDEKIIGPIAVNDLDNQWLKLSNRFARMTNLGSLMMFETIDDALDYIIAQTKTA